MDAVVIPAKTAINGPAILRGIDLDDNCFTLRRTGLKALRFQGWQIVDAVGLKDGREVWHDLNIYLTVDQHVVVELMTRHNVEDRQDFYEVEVFCSLKEAATWLQAYDATNHAPIPFGLGITDTSLPWAVMQAVHLRQTMDRIGADYKALLTEVFMALELTESVEGHVNTPLADII